jgi:hypothetical protein
LSWFSTWAGDKDLDWALWAFQGSYCFRQNPINMEEYFGVLNINLKIDKSKRGWAFLS